MEGIFKKDFNDKRFFIENAGEQFFGFLRKNVIKRRGDQTAAYSKTEENQDHGYENSHNPEKRGKDQPVPGLTLGNIMNHYFIKEIETKIYSSRKQNDVDYKRDNDVFQQRRMVFDEFCSSERVEKTSAEITNRIVFNTYGHGIIIY